MIQCVKIWASTIKKHTATHNVTLRNPQTGHEIHLSPAEGDKYIKAQLSQNQYDSRICKEQVFTGLNCPMLECHVPIGTKIYLIKQRH